MRHELPEPGHRVLARVPAASRADSDSSARGPRVAGQIRPRRNGTISPNPGHSIPPTSCEALEGSRHGLPGYAEDAQLDLDKVPATLQRAVDIISSGARRRLPQWCRPLTCGHRGSPTLDCGPTLSVVMCPSRTFWHLVDSLPSAGCCLCFWCSGTESLSGAPKRWLVLSLAELPCGRPTAYCII